MTTLVENSTTLPRPFTSYRVTIDDPTTSVMSSFPGGEEVTRTIPDQEESRGVGGVTVNGVR